MPFEWQTFLEFARRLLEQAEKDPDPEAVLRSVASRAYFAAYGHARIYAARYLQFASREEVEDHGRLRAHLKGRRRKGDADRLGILRQFRNEADYLDRLPWTDPVATAASGRRPSGIQQPDAAKEAFVSISKQVPSCSKPRS
jgi:hypothetical protein